MSTLSAVRPPQPRRAARNRPVRPGLVEGLCAAALGLGALAVVVLLLWTVSPHPDDGPDGALRIAADLWLLAHGVALVRAETASGVPAPVGVTPLLLSALPAWLLCRAMRGVVEPEQGTAAGVRAALLVCAGYLSVAAGTVFYVADGPIRAEPWSTALQLPLFALAVTLAAAGWICGLPVPRWRARWLHEGGAARAAAAGLAAACGAGAVLAAVALIRHGAAAQTLFGQLAGDWSGRIALLLLACALAPNAAVWATAYGLGPGFALGGGVVLAPLVAGEVPQPPPFPLLAALPGEGGTASALLAAAVVPVTGVLVTAWFLARSAAPVRADRETALGWRDTAVAALLAAVLLGAGAGVLARLAGGPLGSGALAEFGPDPWLTGLAGFGWIAVAGLPAALLGRAWRLRGPEFTRSMVSSGAASARGLAVRGGRGMAGLVSRPGHRPSAADPAPWHATLSRETRWAALKKASGGLVPDLPGGSGAHAGAGTGAHAGAGAATAPGPEPAPNPRAEPMSEPAPPPGPEPTPDPAPDPIPETVPPPPPADPPPPEPVPGPGPRPEPEPDPVPRPGPEPPTPEPDPVPPPPPPRPLPTPDPVPSPPPPPPSMPSAPPPSPPREGGHGEHPGRAAEGHRRRGTT